MAANPDINAAWNTAPLTKFRPPRVRREVVARPALLQRLCTSIDSCPVTLICAPGGSGKTTLLAQWVHQCPAGTVPLWIAIDEDDNDRHRLFATLLRALEPLQLVWDLSPVTLLSHSAGSDSQCRAALAALVNALCTASAARIVLVLDDLHRIDRGDVFELLESLIERLPDHVALVLGSRVEPMLPLARWRAHGDLAEFIPWDLQFTEAETALLAQSRLGTQPDPQAVRDVLRRTHGWAAGLTLVLQSRARPEDGGTMQMSSGDAADRHLFAYLAQEILADLPEDIREFVLECSILAELDPDICAAVTRRSDAQRILDSLYRRNLFLTATDDSIPVLRFHDLFRDFLQKELEDRHPGRMQELHERAGRAERSLPRAIGHLLKAQCWADAVELIGVHGESMLAEGDHAVLERWIDQIPASARLATPRIGYLRGLCYWLHWDWPNAKRELEPAIAGIGAEHAELKIRAMFLQADAFNSSGESAAAWSMLEEIARHPLDDPSKAQLALQRAWCVLPNGDPEAVGRYLMEFIGHAEKAPEVICPATADRIHCLCIGMPAVADCFERFFAMSELVRGQTSAPWQLAALAVGAWGQFWRGRREPVERAIERGEVLHHQFGSMRLVSERLLQFRALYLAASGQYEPGEALIKKLIEALQAPEASAHRAVWQRAYQHGLARFYWMAGDHQNFRSLAPALLAPRVSSEWPFLDTAAELVRGQLAILREDWRTAGMALEEAVRTHERYRMPMSYGDPRITLAYMHLLREARGKAWNAFEPVMQEIFEQQAFGLLLLEPRSVVNALLETVPVDLRRSAELDSLTAKLALWNEAAPQSAVIVGPLSVLSEREREVLALAAVGASNKHIARQLSLSLHTVKRHIANVLDKLDCASRGQAADLYRREGRGA